MFTVIIIYPVSYCPCHNNFYNLIVILVLQNVKHRSYKFIICLTVAYRKHVKIYVYIISTFITCLIIACTVQKYLEICAYIKVCLYHVYVMYSYRIVYTIMYIYTMNNYSLYYMVKKCVGKKYKFSHHSFTIYNWVKWPEITNKTNSKQHENNKHVNI